jgi:surface antigen
MKAQRAHTQRIGSIGETIAWNNPDTGHSGTVTATRDGYANNGDYCREFHRPVACGNVEQGQYGMPAVSRTVPGASSTRGHIATSA